MRLPIYFVLAVTFLAGCAVTKVPVATSGSRSDGVIEMTYEYGAFESPQVDWERTRQDAADRCARLGYKRAEVFGGSKRACVSIDPNGGCNRWQVTTDYQCTD